ncbi:hypothetical protein T190611E02C_40323 [Tenacibaculum sp. 190524A05c]|uniref:hypothetical protein n=1 Tax=Tenacibaculum platacis TaxID=3137852 RepID=UPI0031FB7D76
MKKTAKNLKELESYSISDLKLLINECSNIVEGCKNREGELDEVGEVNNDKLDMLWDVYDKKVKDVLDGI